MKAKHLSIKRFAEFHRWLLWAVMFCASLLMAGCAGRGEVRERDYLPGNSPYYSFGIAQSKENFSNVKRAQVAKGLYSDERSWGDFGPGLAPGTIVAIQYYFPFSVRWELNDKRQLMLVNIDVRSIMKEYFKDKNNDLTLPWQNEGRQRHVDDYDPALVYEVKDDALRIKWLITDIRTPLEQRYAANGARLLWSFDRKEYLVKEIKGQPVQGIDFDAKLELRKNINR